MSDRHEPVLLREVLQFCEQNFSKEQSARVLDVTLGGAGHAKAILEKFSKFSVVGCDRDEEAVERCKEVLAPYGERAFVRQAKFSEVETDNYDIVIADLGISSFQLDSKERGFALRFDGPLDMRMSIGQELSASEVINEYSPQKLLGVLKRGGVGNFSRALSGAIVDKRPLKTTFELKGVCEEVGRKAKTKKDLAVVCFQAVRIEVNDELAEVRSLLELIRRVGGLALVISFHSIEDRLIAGTFRDWARGETPSRNVPVGTPGIGKLLTPKPVVPSEDEILRNSRARSALLRVFKFDESTTAKID